MSKQKRVAARYIICRIDGYFWAKAFDQGNNRYVEADCQGETREELCKMARERVNKSFVAESLDN